MNCYNRRTRELVETELGEIWKGDWYREYFMMTITRPQPVEPDSNPIAQSHDCCNDWQLARTRPHLWERSTEKYRWAYNKYLCSRLSPVDKRGSVPMGPSVMPKKTKFGRKVRNFNKHTEFVSYYLIPDSKSGISRVRSTKTASNSLRVINLGKLSIPNNKSLLDKVPSRSTN